MAEIARRSAAGPAAPGWGDVQRRMMAAAQVCAVAVAQACAGGDDSGVAVALAGLAIGELHGLAALARRLDVGEAVIEAERDRAVAEDRETWPRRLRAVT
jgi:hypothetical protein